MDSSKDTEKRKYHHPYVRRDTFGGHHPYIMNLISDIKFDLT
jgi:hypothetical protein